MILNIISCKTKEKINQDATITVEKLIECIKNNDEKGFKKLKEFEDKTTQFYTLNLLYPKSLIKNKKIKANLKDTIYIGEKVQYYRIPYYISDNPSTAYESFDFIVYFYPSYGYEKIFSYTLEYKFRKKKNDRVFQIQ